MPNITDCDGTTAAQWLAKLRFRIEKQRTTGFKFAYEVVTTAHEAEWILERTENGERRYFVVHQGAYRDGTVKRWRITCIELSEKHQKKTGKRWRINASLVNVR